MNRSEHNGIARAVEQCSRRFLVAIQGGLRARPAMMLARAASAFEADVVVSGSGASASAKSVLGLLMLGAVEGTMVTVSATGRDAVGALRAVGSLFDHCLKGHGASCPDPDACLAAALAMAAGSRG